LPAQIGAGGLSPIEDALSRLERAVARLEAAAARGGERRLPAMQAPQFGAEIAARVAAALAKIDRVLSERE
jgi:hypothetical protein